MANVNMPGAQEAAFFSNAYQGGFTRLEDFSREQSKKFEHGNSFIKPFQFIHAT
jgi:hypothetical protein